MLFLVDFLINVRKNCHFWSYSISHSFVGICDTLLNFYFGFDIEKTIPVYIPTLLVMSFIYMYIYKIAHHLLNAHELEYASFYHCRKWSTILCVAKNWYYILIETINKSVKSVLTTQNTHLLYRKLLPKWYFELQPDYVESTYTPKIARIFVLLSTHVKRQCIRVLLCKLVRYPSVLSHTLCTYCIYCI